ncbi:hypothetical protein P170DRAFT_393150 [Aspergillus steynii IBT 23096]|uniref:DUF676 domain-containing protein n=1 Tax=Aspergillus steynii IBT 23096 TaxID=1392250 RepID=A0A2I2FVL3_9EURO|nr:uncharacterized protein P170DRAFT_393150 [Aspergillus steynii IBT 23096]PLB44670.1 hypothetical protein P170DRAFT_393150 [Aspergillus steynii IBT 23096]
MLLNPTLYSASQTPDRGHFPLDKPNQYRFLGAQGWRAVRRNVEQAAEMLLIHQAGSVRVGEVVRYTITYTPAAEKIHPLPEKLFVKVKNTSAIPLRAAYLHGPYTLYASCYPSTFDPNVKSPQQDTDETPQFEPYLKAGGNWDAVINVPQNTPINNKAGLTSSEPVTWVVEIISQVIFSSTASVNFELLVGRDKKSTELPPTGGLSTDGYRAAQLRDHWSSRSKGKQVHASKGVHSDSITLLVDDTASLWNFPSFPGSPEEQKEGKEKRSSQDSPAPHAESSANVDNPASSAQYGQCKKKIHLVILTHGLHSNLGADMLYLKESIDTAARNTRDCAKDRHRRHGNKTDESRTPRDERSGNCANGSSKTASCNGADDDVEQVIVRGFPGNAVRTERGIQYLGKRLAKYVLLMTYPDQPHLPGRSASTKSLSKSHSTWKNAVEEPSIDGPRSDSSMGLPDSKSHAYKITSISFIGHSLGGLIQTYAIAYIQKHYPGFFDAIKPVNFVALATPFLGLSNENPMYVRFALDLGLVGRTGQDLGLSWTAPRVRSGWEAMIGGKGDSTKPHQHANAGSKPLLRILPCGPAHDILSKFQNRTVYSNVVNDGIVPLRTSCLLFLDWKGLDRVEKARRGNGIVGTMAEWGWAELTGANSKSPQTTRSIADFRQRNPPPKGEKSATAVDTHDAIGHGVLGTPNASQTPNKYPEANIPAVGAMPKVESTQLFPHGSLGNIFSMFRPKGKVTTTATGYKQTKIYKRSQTLPPGDVLEGVSSSGLFRRESLARDGPPEESGSYTPPKTTLFESASDLLMPPLPPVEFIVDPESRARTIFHDRLYRPEDIPPPLPTKRRTLTFGSSQSKPGPQSSSLQDPQIDTDYGEAEPERGLKVEEKIARAYHRNLSWRKVLVRLEPDAHNNIIVRRMFTNAYGWPVVKHLVDTHFGCTSMTDDVSNYDMETADPPPEAIDEHQSGVLNTGSPAEVGHSRDLLDDTAINIQGQPHEFTV